MHAAVQTSDSAAAPALLCASAVLQPVPASVPTALYIYYLEGCDVPRCSFTLLLRVLLPVRGRTWMGS